jgi:hypothetical protein
MTQTTDREIDELKMTMNAIAKATEANAKAIEANAKAIADLTLEMRVGFAKLEGKIEANTKAIENLAKMTEANAKAIAELTVELRVGFAHVDTKLAKQEVLDLKVEERTKGLDRRLDAKELTQRGVFTVTVGGLLLAIAKYLFFGIKA